jgi:hypothetical protein
MLTEAGTTTSGVFSAIFEARNEGEPPEGGMAEYGTRFSFSGREPELSACQTSEPMPSDGPQCSETILSV